MKTQIKVMITVLLMAVPLLLTAQQAQRRGQREHGQRMDRFAVALELTDDQQTRIEELKTEQMKETLTLSNQLNEIKAKLQTLRTADAPDLKEINSTIDDLTSTQAKMMKAREATHQEIRKILNDKQRIKFDSMNSRIGKERRKRVPGPDRRGIRGR